MYLWGDNLKVLPSIKDNAVDLILTDPPYGLEFMGKEWDKISSKRDERRWGKREKKFSNFGITEKKMDNLPQHEAKPNPKCKICGHYKWSGTPCKCELPDWDLRLTEYNLPIINYFLPVWLECYRVLKPGAFILVMASPRNDDLVSVSLREAGFVKHNSIYWVYGSGFPKGTDVSKAIDKKADDNIETLNLKLELGKYLKERREAAGFSKHELDEMLGTNTMYSWYEGRRGGVQFPTWKYWIKLKEILSFDDRYDYLIEDRPSEYIEAEREILGKMESSLGGTVAAGERNQEFIEKHRNLEYDITAPATPLAKEFKGMKYGIQALKPAAEVILVFQKPFDGSPLENILKWRVGCINVDEGRIGAPSKVKPQIRPTTDVGGASWSKGEHVPFHYPAEGGGRYPSNFLLSHSPGCRVVGERRVRGTAPGGKPTRGIEIKAKEIYGKGFKRREHEENYADADGRETVRQYECEENCAVRELDRQSGVLGNAWRPNRDREKPVTPGIFGGDKLGATYPDTGTASRFFYQPEWGPADFRYIAKASSAERSSGCEHFGGNIHPTCKPIELARYLIKLYRGNNPNSVILDPFAGSGWVEIACILEDCKSISIEAEWEYCEIGEARSAYWTRNKQNYLTEGTLPKYRPELPLFESEE